MTGRARGRGVARGRGAPAAAAGGGDAARRPGSAAAPPASAPPQQQVSGESCGLLFILEFCTYSLSTLLIPIIVLDLPV